jgi:hypothetical protein
MSEWNFIIAAYALAWVTILTYGAHVWRRVRRAERALADIERTGGVR